MGDFFLIIGGILLCAIPIILIVLIVQAVRKRATKVWIVAFIISLVLFLTFEILGIALSCKHNYIVTEEIAATCTTKGLITSYCDLCGKQKTEKTTKIQHNMVEISRTDATFSADGSITEKCEFCGKEKTSTISKIKCSHEWQDATCLTPQTCSICKKEKGNALDHSWIDATCEDAKKCKRCELSEGSPLEHNWSDGTCTEDSKCLNCDAIQKAEGHQWIDASCTQPKTCKICNTVESTALGHSWIENSEKTVKICERCGVEEKLVSSNPSSGSNNPEAKTSDINVRFETDYIDEDRLHLTIFTKNNSDETFVGDIYVALYSSDGKRLLGSDVIIVDELLPGRESWAKMVVDAYLGIPRMEIDFWNVSFHPIEKITAEIDEEATKATKDSYYWGFYDVSWYSDITDITVHTDGNCIVTVKSSTKNEGQSYAATIWGCGNEHGVKSVQVIDPEGTVLAIYP